MRRQAYRRSLQRHRCALLRVRKQAQKSSKKLVAGARRNKIFILRLAKKVRRKNLTK